jgi:hypothetical protein
MPLGYETSSVVIPQGETKYTYRSPADGPSFIDVGSLNTLTPFRADALPRRQDRRRKSRHGARPHRCSAGLLSFDPQPHIQTIRSTDRSAFQHPPLVDLRSRIDAEVLLHPVVVRRERAHLERDFAADHVNKKSA